MKSNLNKERTETVGKRQIQAAQTKQRIFDEAQRLFTEKGINQVGISDIVKAANVSTGTFYLYFSSKEEILAEIFMEEEDFYEELLKSLNNKKGKAFIIEYFVKRSEHMEKKGAEIIRQLYYPSNPFMEEKNDASVMKDLISAVSEAQERKEVSSSLKTEELALYLQSLNSGIIFEWCLSRGKFSLKRKVKKYIEIALQSL